METKKCRICLKEKKLKDLKRERKHTRKNGCVWHYQTLCKVCGSKIGKQWRDENKEHCRQQQALRKEKRNKNNKAYRERYREKNIDTNIHKKVQSKIISGEIKKDVCKICGSKQNIHAHHEDYAKIYEIEWLCRECHNLWHVIKEHWKKQEKDGRFNRQALQNIINDVKQ